MIAIVYLILRARILAGVIGTQELTDQDVRDAVAGILDAFIGGLFTWGLVLGLAGFVVAGAAAALDPDRTSDPVLRLQRVVTRRPESTPGRLVRGVAAVAAGFIFALDWQFAFSVVGLLAGAYLIYFGAASCSCCSAAAGPSRRRRAVCAGAASGARSPSSPSAWGPWSPR